MATRTWVSLVSGNYDNVSNWGGVAVSLGDTDIVASPGGGTPGTLGQDFIVGGSASEVDFFNFPAVPVQIDATLAQVPVGDTIGTETIDFVGGSSYTVSDMRRTTLSAGSTLNISGTSIAQATFDNSLDGTINIGDPAATTPDAHGYTSELELNQYGLGSFNLTGDPVRRAYTPSTTNNGTVNISGGAYFNVDEVVGPGAATQTLTSFGTLMTTAGAIDGWADFFNAGTINIAPGGALRIDDGGSGYGGLINSGRINIEGAQGVSSTSTINAIVLGPGLITIDGGTQTDPTQTTLQVSETMSSTNIALRDATLFTLDENQTTRDYGGSLYFEGNAILRVYRGGDGLITPTGATPGSPNYTYGIAKPFGMPIYGFGVGDIIEIDNGAAVQGGYDPGAAATTPHSSYVAQNVVGSGTTTYTAYTSWNQTNGQLALGYTTTDLEDVYDPTSDKFSEQEVTSAPIIAGTFTLMGPYAAADFHATFTLGFTETVTGGVLALGLPGYVAPELMVTTTDAAPTYATTATPGTSGGTVFTTPVVGGSVVSASAGGNDVVNSQGLDTINAGGGTDVVFASGAAATVNGGAGSLVFVAGGGSYAAGGGTASDILYGGAGNSTLTGGAGAGSIMVAGSGNVSLVGGAGNGALMFGGTASSTFAGSAAGSDTMVGGAGPNTFTLTGGDIAFGGPSGPDTYFAGSNAALIVEGAGSSEVVLGSGNLTAFAGAGPDTYLVTKGQGDTASIIGFKASDHISLLGGFTAADASSAVTSAVTGSFGTALHFTDGTTITLFGAAITATQISAG